MRMFISIVLLKRDKKINTQHTRSNYNFSKFHVAYENESGNVRIKCIYQVLF